MDAPSLPNHKMFQSVVPRSLRKIFPRISSMWTTLGHSPQKERPGVRLDPNSRTMDCFDLGLTTLHLNDNYKNIREKECPNAKAPSTSDRRLSLTTFKLSLLSKVCPSSFESCTKSKGTMVEDDRLPPSLLKSPITKDNMIPSVNNNLSVDDLAEGKICDRIIIATPSINKSRKRLKLTQQVSPCGQTGKRPGSTSRVPRIGRSRKKLLCKHRLASALNMLTGSPSSHVPLGDETRSLLAEDLPQGHSQDCVPHTGPLLPDTTNIDNGLQSDLGQEPSVLLPILWNKYLSVDNTCGLLATSGSIDDSINRLLPPRSSVPHHLDQIVDAATLPFESGDGRSGPRYKNTFGWSDDHKSPNIVLSQVGGTGGPQTTARRCPVAMSTDAVRGSVGLSRGLHVWRVDWPLRHRGTHAVIGVVRGPDPTATYRTDGYRPLIGVNRGSWGWDLVSNRLFDGDKAITAIANGCPDDANPPTTNYLQSSIAVCRDEGIHAVLDMGLDSGTLGFYANGRYMGHAFTSAALKTTHGTSNGTNLLYPIISAVWGHCEIRLEYIDGLEDGPFSLKLLSRYVIRKKTPFLANFKTNYGKCQADIPKDLLEYLAS